MNVDGETYVSDGMNINDVMNVNDGRDGREGRPSDTDGYGHG
ncbi:hypothetical protein [Streptomyces sp. NPDC001537]|jgi:hypothetical protein